MAVSIKRVAVIIGILSFFSLLAVNAHADERIIGDFSKLDPSTGFPKAWEALTFPNIDRHTQYRLVRDDGRIVIRADSQNAASGMIRSLRIDPRAYPVIHWRWKVDHVLKNGDLTKKKGDDYAARIYVAFAFEPKTAGWWAKLRHKSAAFFAGKELPGTALNYIWANRAPIGTIATNRYAEEAKMIAVQSGNDLSGQWVTEQRNIMEDYQQAFGGKPPEIIGIAIMTDTDNTGEATTAYYGDIVLSSQ